MTNAMRSGKNSFMAETGRIAVKAACLMAEPIAKAFGTSLKFIADTLPTRYEVIGRIAVKDAHKAARGHLARAQLLEYTKKYYEASLEYAAAHDILAAIGNPAAKDVFERMMITSARSFTREEIWETMFVGRKEAETPDNSAEPGSRLDGARAVYRCTIGIGMDPKNEKPMG